MHMQIRVILLIIIILDFCNGTRLPIPIPMLTTPTPSVNPPGGSLSDTTPSFPRSFTKIVSLVEQDADIYDLCSRHEQCPAHAQCRPEGCKGFSCLCDKGYMATTDRKSCVKGEMLSILKSLSVTYLV